MERELIKLISLICEDHFERLKRENLISFQDIHLTMFFSDGSTCSLQKIFSATAANMKECQEFSLLEENQVKENDIIIEGDELSNSDDLVSQIIEAVEESENDNSTEGFSEMHLPGLLIHIVPQERRFTLPFLNNLRCQAVTDAYKAYIANRENFKDINVSPSMLLDHLPWRYTSNIPPYYEVSITSADLLQCYSFSLQMSRCFAKPFG